MQQQEGERQEVQRSFLANGSNAQPLYRPVQQQQGQMEIQDQDEHEHKKNQPIVIKRRAKNTSARKNKDGLQRVYQCCVCFQKTYVNKHQCVAHISSCCKKLITPPISPSIIIKEQIQNNKRDLHDEKTTISELARRIHNIQQTIRTNSDNLLSDAIRCKALVDMIFDEQTKQATISILKNSVYQAIKVGLQNGINMNQRLDSLKINLFNKLNSLKLYEDLDSFRQKLKKYHDILEQEKKKEKKISKQAWSRYQTAFSFLKKYDDSSLKYQVKITNDLLNSSRYLRSVVISYFNQMRRDDSANFGIYPKLSKKIKGYCVILSKKRKIISLSKVSFEIQQLIQEGEFNLACDLWFSVCIGLRKDDLLRVYFKYGDEFSTCIELIEHKNNHLTTRVIPQSLKILIEKYKVQYPMTLERYYNARKFCIAKFSRFYDLRKVCITQISYSLWQSSKYAKFHQNSTTTTNFYIDQLNEKFISSAFSLQWLPNSKQHRKANICLNFGRIGDEVEVISVGTKTMRLRQPTIDQIVEKDQDQENDGVLTANNNELTNLVSINKFGRSEFDLGYIVANNQIYKRMNRCLLKVEFPCIFGLISELTKDDGFSNKILKYSMLCDYLGFKPYQSQEIAIDIDRLGPIQLKKETRTTDQRILNIISSAYNMMIHYFVITLPNVQPQIMDIGGQQAAGSAIIVKVKTFTGECYFMGEDFRVSKGVPFYQYQCHLSALAKKNEIILRQLVNEVQTNRKYTTISSCVNAIDTLSRFIQLKDVNPDLDFGTSFSLDLSKLRLNQLKNHLTELKVKEKQLERRKKQARRKDKSRSRSRERCSRSGSQQKERTQAKIQTKALKFRRLVNYCELKEEVSMTHLDPKCKTPICRLKAVRLVIKRCENSTNNEIHVKLVCPNCHWSQKHLCSRKPYSQHIFFQRNKIKIVSDGGIERQPSNSTNNFQRQINNLSRQKQENNIKDTIQSRGYIFTSEPFYLQSVPKVFSCNYSVFSDRLTELVIQNRKDEDFLPLQIKKSQVSQQAGAGVFTRVDIQPNTIICSYLGEIGMHGQIQNSDSLFTLGWLDGKAILIAPKRYSNIGRFINSSRKPNCKSRLGLLRYNLSKKGTRNSLEVSDQYEVSLIIMSTQFIRAGSELLYNYGPDYALEDSEDSDND